MPRISQSEHHHLLAGTRHYLVSIQALPTSSQAHMAASASRRSAVPSDLLPIWVVLRVTVDSSRREALLADPRVQLRRTSHLEVLRPTSAKGRVASRTLLPLLLTKRSPRMTRRSTTETKLVLLPQSRQSSPRASRLTILLPPIRLKTSPRAPRARRLWALTSSSLMTTRLRASRHVRIRILPCAHSPNSHRLMVSSSRSGDLGDVCTVMREGLASTT